ncbi:MAG: hypothetical protein AAGH65_08775 [Pseudomonadota bacterium]
MPWSIDQKRVVTEPTVNDYIQPAQHDLCIDYGGGSVGYESGLDVTGREGLFDTFAQS